MRMIFKRFFIIFRLSMSKGTTSTLYNFLYLASLKSCALARANAYDIFKIFYHISPKQVKRNNFSSIKFSVSGFVKKLRARARVCVRISKN